jgi:hypothetical protein
MGSTQAGACILLANRFSELEEHLQDNPDTVKWLMDVKATNITAKSINNNARSIDYRHQLQRRKMNDMKGDNTNSIMAIESHLSHLSQQRHSNVDDALVDHYRYGVQVQPKLQQFYQQSSWARKQQKGQPIFKLNAYNTAAKKLVPRKTENPDTKGKARAAATKTTCQVFYGNAGRGFGSIIKGHTYRSTDKIQASLQARCRPLQTDEYLPSRLCCFCDQRVVHPGRKNERTNTGAVTCINSNCFSRKNGFASRGRDLNAAVNILKIGLYLQATGNSYPAFSRATTATTATIATILFGHPTSWFEGMGDLPSLKGTGDGHSL